MFARENYIENILEKLAYLKTKVNLANSLNLTNTNIHAENFYRDFLNLVFGYSLQNMNRSEANYTSIDLGDSISKISIQVTSTGSINKTRKTVYKFIENKLYQKFDRLIILNLDVKKKHQVEKIGYPGEYELDPKKDIWDIKDIIKVINDLNDLNKIKQISDFLNIQLLSKVSGFDILNSSEKHIEIRKKLREYREILEILPANDINSRNKIIAKIHLCESELQRLINGVLKLAKSFSEIKSNSERFQNAKVLFDEGRFYESAASIDENEIDQELLELKMKQQNLADQQNVLGEQFFSRALELVLKAKMLILGQGGISKLEQADLLITKAIEISDNATLLIEAGNYYNETGRIYKAIECFEKLLTLPEGEYSIASLYYDLGTLYMKTDNEQAIYYLKKCIALLEELNNKPTPILILLGNAYHNLSSCYGEIDTNTQIKYLESAIAVRKATAETERQYYHLMSYTLNRLSGIAYLTRNKDIFFNAFEQSLCAMERFIQNSSISDVLTFQDECLPGLIYSLNFFKELDFTDQTLAYESRIKALLVPFEDLVIKSHKQSALQIARSYVEYLRFFTPAGQSLFSAENITIYRKIIHYSKEAMNYIWEDDQLYTSLAIGTSLLAISMMANGQIWPEKIDLVHEAISYCNQIIDKDNTVISFKSHLEDLLSVTTSYK